MAAEPGTREEYERRWKTSFRISGIGSDVTMHHPCPFCAAPGFLDARVFDGSLVGRNGRGEEATCRECGRSAVWVYSTHRGGTSIELVQTGGAPPPPWVPCRREGGAA